MKLLVAQYGKIEVTKQPVGKAPNPVPGFIELSVVTTGVKKVVPV